MQRFAARVVLFHSAVAAKLGLHVTDIRCLRLLAEGPMLVGTLGAEAGLTGAAATALVDRLERAGYVVRERGADDRRRVTVHAVPAKVRQLDALYAGQYARMSKLLAGYTAAEFEVIARFLGQTTDVLAEETKKLHATAEVDGRRHGRADVRADP